MLYLKSTNFIKSIAEISAYHEFCKENPSPQICVVGRSNVGKSSFINLIAGRKNLAKTSSTPGRTRLLNLFDFVLGDKSGETQFKNSGAFVLADLPGYGYAKAPKTEIAKWGSLIEQYFAAAKNLVHVFSLVDIRHEPSELDVKMIKFLSFNGIGFTLIATKADKIGAPQLAKHIQMLATKLGTGAANILPTSTSTGKGKEQAIERLAQIMGNNIEAL